MVQRLRPKQRLARPLKRVGEGKQKSCLTPEKKGDEPEETLKFVAC